MSARIYVLGFAFDQYGRVALIRKDRPEWQRDRWNGIGGKIEANELPVIAMSREFLEETGVEIAPDKWRFAGMMRKAAGPDSWILYVFTTKSPAVGNVQTTGPEQVRLWHTDAFQFASNRARVMNDIPALIELCRIQAEGPGQGVPTFNLEY